MSEYLSTGAEVTGFFVEPRVTVMNSEPNRSNERGYHDIGGNKAGEIPREEPPWLHWEKQVEAIRNLLGDGTRRIVSLDEMRRGFESFGEDKYQKLSFYRRRLEAMTDILTQKDVVSRAELDAEIAKKKVAWDSALKNDTSENNTKKNDTKM